MRSSSNGELPNAPYRLSRGPIFALTVLFSMNLLNYVDRYVFSATGKTISDELKFKDVEFGYLSAAFMVVYTIVSPVVGWLGDRYSRRAILSFGVALWSVATVGTAFARGFGDMFLWRALLGIGEASYGVIAPPLIADLFEPKRRGRAMSFYYLALPLGGAIGYLVGGHFAKTDWRQAFWVVGVPGLLAAFCGFLIRDPGRGASEGKVDLETPNRPKLSEYLEIFKTKTFMYNTAGQAAATFAIGAYAAWGAFFYQRVRGMAPDEAGRWIGGMTAVAGLLGIGLGTVVPDFLSRFTKRSYMLWCCFALLVSTPFIVLGVLDPDQRRSLTFFFVSSLMLSSVLAPFNVVTASVVPASKRAAGFAISIFLLHLFGDISSPAIIGWVSDELAKPYLADSALGRLLESIGASPNQSPTGMSNLTGAMLSVTPVLLLGCLLVGIGARYFPADQERARSQGGPGPEEFPVGH